MINGFKRSIKILFQMESTSKLTKRPRTTKNIKITATTDISEKDVVKRKSKKKFPVVAIVTPDGVDGNLYPQVEIRKPLIVHLPIQSRDISINSNILCYNPEPPPSSVEPYDRLASDLFSSTSSEVPETVPDNSAEIDKSSELYGNVSDVKPPQPKKCANKEQEICKSATMLMQFKGSSEIRRLPESSDVACHWCCHLFDNRPVVLPIKDEGEYLYVHGNFCCPECAAGYLFDMRQDFHTRWEQYSLLNRVYTDKIGDIVKPAPSKCVLKHFGGPLTISEFRAVVNKGRLRIDVHIPPMVSILSTMDTKPIDFYDVNLTKDVMETAKERLQKMETSLKLQRTKPLKAWESTLDACMNLRIKSIS